MNAVTTRPAAAELPDCIEGLDIRLGLSHMAGKKPLYLAMLRRFADSHADAGQQIRSSLARGDRETAHRLAHTLKSVSAMLGAVDVREKAAQLEHALDSTGIPADVQGLVAALEQPLDSLIGALNDCL